jgi:hypothetical protein
MWRLIGEELRTGRHTQTIKKPVDIEVVIVGGGTPGMGTYQTAPRYAVVVARFCVGCCDD